MTDIPNLRKTEAEWREIITETMTRRISYIDGIWDILRANSLILPDPESDLLKEAREIAKIGGYEEDEGVVQIILAALKHRKDG